eukprot:COSAG01_NODE_27966_length_672_cov_1.664921_2_plen_71_part_00
MVKQLPAGFIPRMVGETVGAVREEREHARMLSEEVDSGRRSDLDQQLARDQQEAEVRIEQLQQVMAASGG